MIIECSYCECQVDGKILKETSFVPPNEEDPVRLSFVNCPKCTSVEVYLHQYYPPREEEANDEDVWVDGERIWPKPERKIDFSLPPLVKESLKEAKKCYKAKAYIACAVMCGRALEAIGVDYKVDGVLHCQGQIKVYHFRQIKVRHFE